MERWIVWEVEGRLTGSGMRKEVGAAARELERVNGGGTVPKCMSGGTDCETSRSMGPIGCCVTGISTSEAGRTFLQKLSWL